MRHLKALATAAVLTLLAVLMTAGGARAATSECAAVPAGACSSWQTPVAGGVNLDDFQQRVNSGNPLIIFTPGSSDPAEDFEVFPVKAGSVSVYSYAGVTASPGLAEPAAGGVYVNIVYAPKGVSSGMCVSDVDPSAAIPMQLRRCATAAGEYNPFQTFAEVTLSQGDGVTFVTFEDAPVSTTDSAATGLFMAAGRTDLGVGRPGARISVLSAPENLAVEPAAPFTQELWAAQG